MAEKPGCPHCHAGRDGDCDWQDCPQERDNEPKTSGRYCPYAAAWEDYWTAETGDPHGRL